MFNDRQVESIVILTGAGVSAESGLSTFRDAGGRIVSHQRLNHPDRRQLVERLSRWPAGIPVVMEASFGWGWISDLVEQAGMEVHLSNCFKVEQMRKARGWVKTNKKDADLVSLLPFEQSDWWKVWRAPPDVRDRREQFTFWGSRKHGESQWARNIYCAPPGSKLVAQVVDDDGYSGRRVRRTVRRKRHDDRRKQEPAAAHFALLCITWRCCSRSTAATNCASFSRSIVPVRLRSGKPGVSSTKTSGVMPVS